MQKCWRFKKKTLGNIFKNFSIIARKIGFQENKYHGKRCVFFLSSGLQKCQKKLSTEANQDVTFTIGFTCARRSLYESSCV